MTTKAKRKTRSQKAKTQVRVVPLSQSRFQEFITCIGFESQSGISVKKLRLPYDEMKSRLGGKAAGLAVMSQLGIPVPPAINLSTQLCNIFLHRQKLPEALIQSLDKCIQSLEKKLGKGFGSVDNPLLLSVRSGARVSMPGMMDTILNLGLNTKIVHSLVEANPSQARFWWDCYRRLIVMFADVVLGLERYAFERALDHRKNRAGVQLDSELSAEDLRALCEEQLLLIRDQAKEFPQDPREQLHLSIEAVFRSWNTDRAIHYRQLHKIPEDWGTSVTIQAMVFGNRNEKSGTGVVFTRNPSTGEKELFGEYLINAQGEDVVAGIRTPQPISSLEKELPTVFRQLKKHLKRLEDHFQDVQDVEFTIEDSKLFILQTRSAKRGAAAAIEHLVQFVREKRISKAEALERFSFDQAKALLHPSLKSTDQKPIGRGLPASPGAVSGRACFSPDSAVQMNRNGEPVILIRRETSPEDIMGMSVSAGILTATGGMTSHAAVVGRGMGKTCIVGCTDLRVYESENRAELGGVQINAGDWITIDGSSGAVYLGQLPTEAVKWNESARSFFKWADELSNMKVLANADTPEQARLARELGAKGIGLCRTEHMFFERTRLHDFRKMILAEDELLREKCTEGLLTHQYRDFVEIFEAMKDLEVTVRLLDPPLHEFLPAISDEEELSLLSQELKRSVPDLTQRLRQLHEMNPMLGHRGCRLAVSFPQIYRMQVRALARAFSEVEQRKIKLKLKIMIPLISDPNELSYLLQDLKQSFQDALSPESRKSALKAVRWGTMIEVPRACVLAGRIASHIDFFSFGTNDLTQTGFGISRDDANKFLPEYIEKRILEADPFESLDQLGIGQLIEWAATEGRKVKPELELGICGEHGGDPKSIEFFHRLGFNSVSCSSFRVPIARMSCGRLARENKKSRLSSAPRRKKKK